MKGLSKSRNGRKTEFRLNSSFHTNLTAQECIFPIFISSTMQNSVNTPSKKVKEKGRYKNTIKFSEIPLYFIIAQFRRRNPSKPQEQEPSKYNSKFQSNRKLYSNSELKGELRMHVH